MDKYINIAAQCFANKTVGIVIFVVLVVLILLTFKYKMKLCKAMCRELVIEMEYRFNGPAQGSIRLKHAVEKFKLAAPWYIRVLPLEKLAVLLVQKAFNSLEHELDIVQESKRDIANQVADALVDKAVHTKFKGNNQLISNGQLYRIKEDFKKDSKGFIEGQFSSDLKGNTRVGVKAGLKF